MPLTSVAVVDALRWVCGVLSREHIPFQVVGDIAALLEDGASRVRRVELFICAEHLLTLLHLVEDYIVECPWRRRDDRWDLVTMVLKKQGVLVLIGVVDGARIRIGTSNEWQDAVIDLDSSRVVCIKGIETPVALRSGLATALGLPAPGEECP